MPHDTRVNSAELGSQLADDAAFDALIERVAKFNPDTASIDDVLRIAKATKLIAEHTLALHATAQAARDDAQRKAQVADVCEAVMDIVNPRVAPTPRLGMFGRR